MVWQEEDSQLRLLRRCQHRTESDIRPRPQQRSWDSKVTGVRSQRWIACRREGSMEDSSPKLRLRFPGFVSYQTKVICEDGKRLADASPTQLTHTARDHGKRNYSESCWQHMDAAHQRRVVEDYLEIDGKVVIGHKDARKNKKQGHGGRPDDAVSKQSERHHGRIPLTVFPG